MAKFEELIQCLCTFEMVKDGTAKLVEVKGKLGYLMAYDAGDGFSFMTAVEFVNDEDNCKWNLEPGDITIFKSDA